MKFGKSHDAEPISGIFFYAYKAENIMSSVVEAMELFLMHSPFYIPKDNEPFKFHVTKESLHRLFLN